MNVTTTSQSYPTFNKWPNFVTYILRGYAERLPRRGEGSQNQLAALADWLQSQHAIYISGMLRRKRPIGIKPLKSTLVLSCSLERNFPFIVVAVMVSPNFSIITRHLSYQKTLLLCHANRGKRGIAYFPLLFFIKNFHHN